MPVVATQDPELRKRMDIDKGADRLHNFLKVCTNELKDFAKAIAMGADAIAIGTAAMMAVVPGWHPQSSHHGWQHLLRSPVM